MSVYNHFFKLFIVILNINIAFANKSINLLDSTDQIIIPKILDEEDKKIYLEITKLQIDGKWNAVDEKTKILKNNILEGYLEYDKLMHPNKYRSSYEELSNWLRKYNDFPVVMQRRVYNLMIRRSSEEKKVSNLKKPEYGNYLRGYGENKIRYSNYKNKKKGYFNVNKQILKQIDNQEYNKLLNNYKDKEKIRTDIIHFVKKSAEKKFKNGFLRDSMRAYEFLTREIQIREPNLYFKAGLNAFRLKKYNQALEFFNDCNNIIENSAATFSPKIKSACLYWEGKLSSNKNKKIKLYTKALKYNRTMYGQLAVVKLNKKDGFIWNAKNFRLSDDENTNIYNIRAFRRLIALSELNLYDKADLEMRNLYSKLENNVNNAKFLLHLSEKLDLAAVQMRLGESFFKNNYILFMRGMYPTPQWNLSEEMIFDKALIYAIIRRESAFNFKAKSSKGALGLMQLMPRTASKIKKDHRLRYGNKHKLYSLDLNLELGQKLLKELINDPNIEYSILNTLIAYNAGITRVKKWNKNINESDPLAFIESIPIRETRMFVKSILTDLWIYKDKFGQSKPTRDNLANDKWPLMSRQDFRIARDAKFR